MDFSGRGYVRYNDKKPERKLVAECIDEHGANSWTAQIGPDGGGGAIPYWWRPALSKDDLWREIVKLRQPMKFKVTVEGGGG